MADCQDPARHDDPLGAHHPNPEAVARLWGTESAIAAAGGRRRYASSERPVIPSGCSIPSRARAVGATSARMPGPPSDPPATVTMKGTGLVECAVFGEPSGSSMLSQFP